MALSRKDQKSFQNNKEYQKNQHQSQEKKGKKEKEEKGGITENIKVIDLSFTNIALIAGIILGLVIIMNSLLQPKLGERVDIDTFLKNIKENHYSQVDIRNDGNAVAQTKYIDIVSVQVDKKNNEDEQDQEVENKEISDLINYLKPPENIQEYINELKNNLGVGNEYVSQIIILNNSIIVDWEKQDKKDWLIEDIDKKEFVNLLSANNLDIASLPIPILEIFWAGNSVDANVFEKSNENEKYQKKWYLDDQVIGLIKDEKVNRHYVNFGTATSDFTKFLQEEGINLSSQTVEFDVLPIYQIDIVSIFNIIILAGLGVLAFMLYKGVSGGTGGLMQFGRSKARMFFGKKINVNFQDVAGVDEAKQELKEVVDFLKNPNKYRKIGAKIPVGVLMVGEPGTGKTLLARAVAGEANVPFFHTSGSEFEEMLVGAGASRVRDLFEKAKKASPALIFIDEIDAVGRKRGTTIQSSSTEQTLNQILVEMDGFEQRDNVIVIAATNRPDVLDPALLRPGRFDRKVVLDQPDIEGRKAILKIHAENKPLSKDIDLEKVAKRTVGFTGADLENMLNEAAIIVAKQNRKEITPEDIEEAATKVQAGPVRKRKRTSQELKMTAYHEAAHAIVMRMTPQSDPVHRITILSRGMALGYTMPLPETDQLQKTQTKMESKIRTLVAGFTAEEMVFDEVTTGAANDIQKATNIARRMVKEFGMSKKLGLVHYGNVEEQPHIGWGAPDRAYSEDTAQKIDEEVRGIINQAYNDAKKILTDNRDKLDQLVDMLLKEEVVESDEFESLFKAKKEKQSKTKQDKAK